jgi:hypothetical protein
MAPAGGSSQEFLGFASGDDFGHGGRLKALSFEL